MRETKAMAEHRREAEELARSKGMEYLTELPKTVPEGKLLVHNRTLLHPTRRLGSRGSRAWLAPTTERDRYELCDCGWAPELGTHYRVLPAGSA